MSTDHSIHTEHFTIRASEVDLSGKLSLPAICNYFQEVAGNNALQLNFDITDLQAQNLTWVLHRMDINLKEMPDWRETIQVETWPAAGDALRAYRNYRLIDKDGNEFGNCLSYWMMINLETRRPVRIPQAVLDTRLTEREHVTPIKSTRLSPPEQENSMTKIKVRRSDLDMNEHVNNVRFIEWMLECMTEDEIHLISNFDIVFMHESHAGDVITARLENTSGTLRKFRLMNQDGNVIALAEATLTQ